MVGSVSDPVINELITTVNDSAFWVGADTEPEDAAVTQPVCESTKHGQAAGVQPDQAVGQHRLLVPCSTEGGFHFTGLTKPPSLLLQRL